MSIADPRDAGTPAPPPTAAGPAGSPAAAPPASSRAAVQVAEGTAAGSEAAGGRQAPRPPDRRSQHRWVPVTAGWLCLLIGLADIVEVVRPIETRVSAPEAATCYLDNSPPPVIREIAPGIKAIRGEGRPSKHLRRELERMRRNRS